MSHDGGELCKFGASCLGSSVIDSGRGRVVSVKECPMFGSLGIPELLIILFIVILVFGASRLPELGKGIGKGIRNFKDATKNELSDKHES
jgi:sec-independent protein translocase protein TatA